MYSKDRDLTVSIPQGSCAGAAIFNLYCTPLEEVIPNDLQISGFTDDHSVRSTFNANDRNAEIETKVKVESCMLKIKHSTPKDKSIKDRVYILWSQGTNCKMHS